MQPGEEGAGFYGNADVWVRCRLMATTTARTNEIESGAMGWGDSVAQWSLAMPEAGTITRALTAGLGQVLLGLGLVLGLAWVLRR